MVNKSEQLCKPTGSSTAPSAYMNIMIFLDLKKTQYIESIIPFSQVRNYEIN